jgi:hypothetical protein
MQQWTDILQKKEGNEERMEENEVFFAIWQM